MGAGTSNRKWIWTNYGGIGFTCAYMVVFLFIFIFACNPVYAAWKAYDLKWLAENAGKFHCKDQTYSGPAVGVASVATDIIAAVLPAGLFWNLHMPKREKILLWAIFGLGLM
jgi:hypothetical protein